MNTYRQDLSDIYQTLKQDQVRNQKQTNAGLWLDKYIENQESKDTDQRELSSNQKRKDSRSELVKEVFAISIPTAYNMFYERWKKMLGDYGAKFQEAEAKGRLAIGLGDESVLETSVTLHRTYGVPYIPGSALKGLAASYADQRLGADWQEDSPAYRVIFGDTENAGYITFFDALYKPVPGYEGQVLYPDVISVHHQKYYQENKAPAPSDRDSPIPVPFLSATGSYLVALAASELEQGDLWIERTFTILKEALATMGIGAKTSSGYGRMKLLEPETFPADPMLTSLDEPKRIELPELREGQEIMGVVATPSQRTSLPQGIAVQDADRLLLYRDNRNINYSLEDVVIVVSAEYSESQNWKEREQRRCQILRIEKHGNLTVLVCKPVRSKFGDKKKRS